MRPGLSASIRNMRQLTPGQQPFLLILLQLRGFHSAFRDTILVCLGAIIGQKSIVLRSHEKSGDKGQKQSSSVERQHSETARETIHNP